jgi:SHS family lactate transporter-like MFS transporter
MERRISIRPSWRYSISYPTETVGTIAIIYNIGAIIGGTTFGALSQRLGRRRTIMLAALLVLPIIPLWAFANSVLWLTLGAFLLQIMVQGAWGVVPIYLNELSPEGVRGTLPGVCTENSIRRRRRKRTA